MNLNQLGVGRPDFVQGGITRAGCRRGRSLRRLLGGVGGLGLLDFVRLLVHAETVSCGRGGVNRPKTQLPLAADRRLRDPNDWAREHNQPRYILDLFKRVIRVSMETNRIVAFLPALNERR